MQVKEILTASPSVLMAHCLPVATLVALLNCGIYIPDKSFATSLGIQTLFMVLLLVLMDSFLPVAAMTKLLNCGTCIPDKSFAPLPDIQALFIVVPSVLMDRF